ncbi:MAG: D-tyrosyl-tRNA(Tyr) deacylase [Candidatus Omnitrophica bacterium]|nr:D-tyrosyl-tRNA(Tyr) deacylase [Candidatus Omnitrophota bacterium]
MKILINRINKGSVKVKGKVKASIEKGLAVFIGIESTDTESTLITASKKIINMRLFENNSGKLSESVKEKGYPILCIPNFTLCALTKKGRRPSFENAMKPDAAKKMFAKFIVLLQNNISVQPGVFGADMAIDLELDGPTNIILKF